MDNNSNKFHREPIPIKVTYTDKEGNLIENSFKSLYQASKTLSISIPTLKELYFGGKPRLSNDTPKDIKVVRINVEKKTEKSNNGKYYCSVCDKQILYRSKYAHFSAKNHLEKLKNKSGENIQN